MSCGSPSVSFPVALLRRNADDHQLEILRAVVGHGMRFIGNDGNSIAFMDGGRFVTHLDLAIAAEDVVDFSQFRMAMQSFGGAGADNEVVHIGPVAQKHGRVEGVAPLHGALAAAVILDRVSIREQGLIDAHGHEYRERIERDVHAGVFEVKGVVLATDGRDVDIHELDGLVGGVADGVRVAQPGGRAHRAFQQRGMPVDREFGFPVEDDEHLLVLIMKMVADAAVGHRHLAAVDEVEQGNRIPVDEHLAGHIAGAAVGTAPSHLANVSVPDALGQRLLLSEHRYRGGE
jgi:hypothetical protein